MKAIDRIMLGSLGLVGLTAACEGAKGAVDPQPVVVTADDPTGDTFETGASAGDVIPDIVRLEATREDSLLVLRIQFAHVMAPSAAGGPNTVVGFIDLDTDQDSLTGAKPAVDMFRPAGTGSTGMGDEYMVMLWSDAQGRYTVVRTGDASVTGTLVPVFNGTTLELRIPASALGGDDSILNFAAVVGTMAEPTDIAPNNGHVTFGTRGAGPAAARVSGLRPYTSGVGRLMHWGP